MTDIILTLSSLERKRVIAMESCVCDAILCVFIPACFYFVHDRRHVENDLILPVSNKALNIILKCKLKKWNNVTMLLHTSFRLIGWCLLVF